MMHGKNNVTKYEDWKRKTTQSVFHELTKAFDKSFNGCYVLRVSDVNKWNLRFTLTLPDTLSDTFVSKIENNEILKNAIILEDRVKDIVTQTFVSFSFNFRIEANTEEELNSKLMYINLMF